MKKAVTLALAAVFAATFAGGSFIAPAYAQSAQPSRKAQGSTRVSIIVIRDYVGPDDFQQVSQIYRYPSARTLARAQEEIRANANIRAALQKRRIPYSNVVGVQTAFNGAKIVYVR